MEKKLSFKCVGDNLEEIPVTIKESTGLKFPEVHTRAEYMVMLSQELKKYKKDRLCRVPFCNTLEAEAMGANIKLGDYKIGPRVKEYAFKSMEELKYIKEIDLDKGRIKEVLKAVETLSSEGEIVALNLEGPFTIISSLIDPMVFYRAIRKNTEIVYEVIKVIEDNIIKYALEGIKRGAKIISYGDPVGTMDMVGPQIYKDLSGKSTYEILKNLEEHLDGALIHLCGKTSTDLENAGLIKSEPRKYDEELTYGQAIENLLKENKTVKIIGHNCIKRTPLNLKETVLWNIYLS